MLAEKLGKFLVALTMTFITSGLLLAGITFKDAANITMNPTPSTNPTIATDVNGNINVVWVDRINTNNIDNVFFTSSTNGGNTWSTPLPLSNCSVLPGATWPHVAVDDAAPINTIYVVWNDTCVGTTPEILFRKSTDGGMSWSPATNISRSQLGDGRGGAKEPRVTAEGNGTVYAVWDHLVSGPPVNCEVHYRKSTDGGNTWNPPPYSCRLQISLVILGCLNGQI